MPWREREESILCMTIDGFLSRSKNLVVVGDTLTD